MKIRHDGWTAERQNAFLELLAEGGSVQKAARAVGMSASSAYRLRMRAQGAFADRWDEAMRLSVGALVDSAIERAIHGTVNPVFYKGEVVGERTVHDSRLTIFLLRMHAPELYDPGTALASPPASAAALASAPALAPGPSPAEVLEQRFEAIRLRSAEAAQPRAPGHSQAP